MLIALTIKTLVAFFGLAAICQTTKARPEEETYLNETSSSSYYEHEVERRSPHGFRHRHQPRLDDSASSDPKLFHGRYYPYDHEVELQFPPGQVLLLKQNKQLLEHEYYEMMNETGPGVDCCPSVLELTQPKGGKNDQGSYVELYRSETYRQRFYEHSCHKDVLGKPCRFIDKKLHPLSRCVQVYSYTYALIKDTSNNKKSKSRKMPTLSGVDRSGNATYTLDYIAIRSGCSCVVMPPTPKKKKKHKVHKTVQHNHHHNNKKKMSSSGVVMHHNNFNEMPVLREQGLDEDYR